MTLSPPHPPDCVGIEGRGGASRPHGAPARCGRRAAAEWPCATLIRPRRATAAGASNAPSGGGVTPSPLNGERAGGRGERAHDVPGLLCRGTSSRSKHTVLALLGSLTNSSGHAGDLPNSYPTRAKAVTSQTPSPQSKTRARCLTLHLSLVRSRGGPSRQRGATSTRPRRR